jgi:hypothetical protein
VGRLIARCAFGALVLLGLGLAAEPVSAFDAFGEASAEATYGEPITFSVELEGGPPDELELLLRVGDDEADFVAPVDASGDSATYDFEGTEAVTPNTEITYRWRAIEGDEVTVSTPQTVLHDDDRFAWQTVPAGETTIHWYGGAEEEAVELGQLSADAVARAEGLLGHELLEPLDVFFYEERDDFFSVLGPGVREWAGAAVYPELRTVFIWLGAGGPDYLSLTLVHEVTHVVFHDATDNPYHEPALWFNEGIAVYSEAQNADTERSAVEQEASSAEGLLAFEGIAQQFPIDDRGGRLAYAQSATLIEMIVDRFGAEAISRAAAAYREGASDAEAIEAGTGVAADELYADFFAEFGAEIPQPVVAEPLLPSDVELPPGVELPPAAEASAGEAAEPDGPGTEAAPADRPAQPAAAPAWLVVTALTAAAALAIVAAIWLSRRAARRAGRGT